MITIVSIGNIYLIMKLNIFSCDAHIKQLLLALSNVTQYTNHSHHTVHYGSMTYFYNRKFLIVFNHPTARKHQRLFSANHEHGLVVCLVGFL